jgi:hypothetical protein
MERAMAGPSITGLFRAASGPRETVEKDRIKADIRLSRDARRFRSPEPLTSRDPFMVAAQEIKKIWKKIRGRKNLIFMLSIYCIIGI